MKVILTGATGFVGGEVLNQLLADSRIAQVTCLLRRDVSVQSPKLKVVTLKDFTQYDEDLAKDLAAHKGCIWTLGGKASDFKAPEEFNLITHTFAMSFVQAISGQLKQEFRFCYLSGLGADPSGSASFPWEKQTRLVKGLVEKDLEQMTKENPLFHATAFRPGGILPTTIGAFAKLLLSPIAVGVDQLSRAMIHEVTLQNGPQFHVMSNRQIKA